jgi:6-phosphogluconolactonase
VPEIVTDGGDGLARWLADALSLAASRALAERDTFSIALPGGSVATRCFPRLARLPIDWSRTHFFWVDERAVPPADPESNFGLADRLWLTPAAVPESSLHRMPAEAEDPPAAANIYAAELVRLLGERPTLDVCLLGMGPDGHVASLFPGHGLLDERDRLVAAVTDSPKPPSRRMTLTLPVLQRARHVIVAAFGSSKAEALSEALSHPDSPLPVAQVLHAAARATVLADREAAARIKV